MIVIVIVIVIVIAIVSEVEGEVRAMEKVKVTVRVKVKVRVGAMAMAKAMVKLIVIAIVSTFQIARLTSQTRKLSLLVRERQVFVCVFCAVVPSARRSMGHNRKWVLQDDIQEAMWRTIFPRTTSSITPVATCPEVTKGVDPAEVSARIADTGPNIAPEAITEAATVEVQGAVAALGGGESSREASVDRPEGGQSETQCPHQCPDRVHHTAFGTSQEEVAGRSRGHESHSTEGPMCCQCGSSRMEVGVAPSAMQQESHRRVDSRTGLFASFGDSRPRRGCIFPLRR